MVLEIGFRQSVRRLHIRNNGFVSGAEKNYFFV